MNDGRRVEELARRLYPDGIMIKKCFELSETDALSREALLLRKPLFEAGFLVEHAFARADILLPIGEDEWELIEVKSSTDTKAEHYYDVAFQKYVYQTAGLKIARCSLMHINREYVKRGELDVKALFIKKDLGEKVAEILPEVPENIGAMIALLGKDDLPAITPGRQCDEVRECPLEKECWSFLPAEGDVFTLHRGAKSAFELFDLGVLDIKGIPANFNLTDKQAIQRRAVQSGQPHVDREALDRFFAKLHYPLYFLDFETISPVIPIYDNSSPYEEIPFQFSLHVIEKEGGEAKHYSFLADGAVDPRPEVLRRLKELLGDTGTILAYYAQYEMKVIERSCRAYPEYAGHFSSVEKRFVDLLEVFQDFAFYHPGQEGRLSIKKVLPILTGRSYSGMRIEDGRTASVEYARVTFDPQTDPAERAEIRAALELYCQLDTQAMIDILSALKNLK
ncbi:MAG: DUF2779 domain-containing protein [Candidatus Margulisbacteria bacterium]|nr:DUF2779 domain-containing protein [Candidatus Margulisiibacteriota bacterium]MBU1616564.1 DUF2779 domain-containing protein [Candidatus Margulisiibacteriota bacterium]